MEKIQKFLAATLLVFVLSLSALAGDITTGVVSPPPPPPASSSAALFGDIHTIETEAPCELNKFVIEISLNLLQMLAVF